MAVYNILGNDISRNVYDINGIALSQAYDISENPLIDVEPEIRIDVLPNQSSGKEAGYSFWQNTKGYLYPLYEVLDFSPDVYNFQSFGYNPDKDRFYKFNTSSTIAIYDSNFEKTDTITLPSSAEYNGGHKNDSYYIDGKFYWPGDYELTNTGFFEWNIDSNTVNIIPVTDIPSSATGAQRVNSAVCRVPDDPDFLYLVYVDLQNDVFYHDINDKLGVYKYDLLTHETTLIAQYPWDCIFVQGAEIYDGILYITCNSQKTGASEPDAGITLKTIKIDTWEKLPSLYLQGSALEPEGMCLYPYGNNPELMMGIGHYGTLSKVTRFSVPYRLIVPDE